MMITRTALDAVLAYCGDNPRVEVCGLLSGPTRDVRLVDDFHPVRNVAEFPATRYELDPREQLALWTALESRGRSVRVVFHSHTTTGVQPSPVDVRYAIDPEVLHLIVSLAGGQPYRLFSIRRGTVVQEPLEVVLDRQPVSD
jgi:proteasome lid subunit RPN8/RPN11